MNPRSDPARSALLSASETRSLARGLGWYSLALGAAELLAPRTVARAAGLEGSSRALVRLYGLREIACGIGILMSRNPAPYVWARVGGDVLDLATVASQSDGVASEGRGRAIGAVTNLASRLADEASAGQILISQRLYAEVEGDVEVEPTGEFTLKGFRRPVPAFNVVAVRAQAELSAARS